MIILLVIQILSYNTYIQYRSGSGPTRVRPQGSVHSRPGPEPTKWGSVHLSLAQTPGPMVSVRSGPRSEPRTVY